MKWVGLAGALVAVYVLGGFLFAIIKEALFDGPSSRKPNMGDVVVAILIVLTGAVVLAQLAGPGVDNPDAECVFSAGGYAQRCD